jgi:uncharacterized iron-regulated membrane protein
VTARAEPGPAAPAAARSRAKPARPLSWRLHQYCGLKLSLLLSFVLLTGTLATISREIDWLLTPALRASTAPAVPASWGALYDAAASAAPGGAVEEIAAPAGWGFASEALVADAQGVRRFVYLDPVTARVQGTGPYLNARRVLRDLHRHLFLPGSIGLPLVSSLSLVLLVLLVTSLLVYKKWWRGFRRWPRPMKRAGEGRRYVGDLHRLAGLWSLWFLALIGATGLWYFAEWAGAEAPDPLAAEATGGAAVDGSRLDLLVARARQALPDLDVRAIAIDPDKGVFVQGQAAAMLVRDEANAVLLDAPSGRVLGAVRGEALSAHQRLSEAADPLHFGDWGGLATRLLWFGFGLLLTLLSGTGALVYALRLQREQGWNVATGLWRTMGPFRLPCALLLLVAFGMLVVRLTQ